MRKLVFLLQLRIWFSLGIARLQVRERTSLSSQLDAGALMCASLMHSYYTCQLE